MKGVLLLTCSCLILSSKSVLGTAIRAPLDIISLDDITPDERKQLDYLHHQDRSKRSGSGDILDTLKTAIGKGIKKKIGEIAHSSASASARLSHSGDHTYSSYPSYHHHVPETYDHKSFDFWNLKKSILNTLLQAVKAIKGGVIAVKGQLIKGGGHLISAKGKLISAKGEAITKLGKNIATSAILVPYHGHSGHGYDSHYTAPSAPAEVFHGHHSASGPEYPPPEHYPPPPEDGPHGSHDGLLLLKKIPGHHHSDDSKVSPFKTADHGDPGWGAIIGKFLSASSSFDPHKPEPFGHTSTGEAYHSDSQTYEESAPVVYRHKKKVEPGASGYVIDDDESQEKPSSGHDVPFEKEPSYLSQSFDEHATSSSNNNPKATKTNAITSPNTIKSNKKPSVEPYKPSGNAQKFVPNDFDIPTINALSLSGPASSSSSTSLLENHNTFKGNAHDLPSISDYPNGFPGFVSLPQSTGELSATILGQTSDGASLYGPSSAGGNLFDQSVGIDLTGSQKPSPGAISSTAFKGPQFFPKAEAENHISRPTSYLETPYLLPASYLDQGGPPSKLSHLDSAPSGSTRYRTVYSKRPSSPKRPSSTRTTHKHKPKTYDVVRSVSYELGPNGPKKLT